MREKNNSKHRKCSKLSESGKERYNGKLVVISACKSLKMPINQGQNGIIIEFKVKT
ncbi:TPA: hypothetical protein KOV09_001105 [Clostridioides difficile]|nr:hypothetical protein [Clostridioides difficile]MDM0190839.1 hypothetical protein [Clostridioides difficile]HBF0045301.1 hypothetical protein [Clostridioides difficile]HBF0052162.1 hypothetical protein [Clostridioides difficile]HBF7022158.1 hypothetical protein [Clostridioides difficile]